MIPLFLALASVLLISPSWGSLSRVEFEEYLEPTCFKLDETGVPFINGQENPLSQTLENFIAMAEKFEVSNPNLGLKEELFYFIRNYTYDNIEYSALGDVVKWNPKDSQFDITDTLWEPDENQRKRFPDGEDPFTDAEKCSIFSMVSHSIIRTPRKVSQQRSSTNYTSKSFGRAFDLDAQYPMELGVVAIRGTEVAVALGKVLTGMYVGLNENRKRSIEEFSRVPKQETSGQIVDYLYTLTLAEVIALSTWRPEVGNREKLASDGTWVSAPIGADLDTNDVCPMIYRLKDGTTSAYSHSSMRGAADGFILGRVIGAIERRNRHSKLSQILRMYYSRGGISERDDEMGQIWASFCNRQNIINPLEQTLREQLNLYQLLVSTSYKNIQSNTDYAWSYYTSEKSSIFGLWNQDLNDHCRKELTVDKPEDLPLESPLDVIAVLDTSDGEENLKKQQLIIGYMAKEMDLRYSGSQMTVLTDQKVVSSASTANGKVVLNPIVTDSHSSSCTACHVTQFVSDGTASAPEDDVIIAIDQFIQAKKENETRYSGVNGKVIIYFNFKDDTISSRPSPLQIRVDKALRDLHMRHQDVAMYALGRAPELVKKYARNDLAFVMSAVDEPENIVGKKLFLKISTAPATLQYHNCVDGKNENGAIFEDFVSPNAVQHWEMPAKYFYKSRDLKISFEAQYGPIRVCHSRATVSPELQKDSCHDVPSGQKKEFPHSNPCKSFNDVSCSPFYFAVLGVNSTDTTKQDYCIDTNTENQCRTLDQIKFKVFHDGIRCSGSVALVATPIVLLVGVLLLNILSRKF